MELNTLTFTPLDKGWDWITVGFGCIALLGLIVLLYQFSQKRKSQNEISSVPIILLVAFATLLASGALIYSLVTTYQMETIVITKTELQTPFGVCALSQIQEVYIYPDQIIDTFIPSPGKEAFLIIVEYDGFQHTISSKTYDISTIYNELKKIIKEQ